MIDAPEGETTLPVMTMASIRRSHPISGDDLQAAVIDASEGEKTMLVTTITSMSHHMATIWAHWITCVIVVVQVHPDVAGIAAASPSWSTGPRDFCLG